MYQCQPTGGPRLYLLLHMVQVRFSAHTSCQTEAFKKATLMHQLHGQSQRGIIQIIHLKAQIGLNHTQPWAVPHTQIHSKYVITHLN